MVPFEITRRRCENILHLLLPLRHFKQRIRKKCSSLASPIHSCRASISRVVRPQPTFAWLSHPEGISTVVELLFVSQAASLFSITDIPETLAITSNHLIILQRSRSADHMGSSYGHRPSRDSPSRPIYYLDSVTFDLDFLSCGPGIFDEALIGSITLC